MSPFSNNSRYSSWRGSCRLHEPPLMSSGPSRASLRRGWPQPTIEPKRITALEATTTLFLAAAITDAALWLALYLRPTPLGAPFALDPSHYVFHAIFYGTW